MALRVLLLSWEYPPIVEGGLARHVRKLSEAFAAMDELEIHVLTRGPAGGLSGCEERSGVIVHRVPEASYPSELPEFVHWVRRLNEDLLARGRALAEEGLSFDLVHGHDWLVALAAKRLADSLHVPYVTTIHATEFGRHQGWVHRPPQSEIHRAERWMARAADRVLVCSHYMRGHVADVFDLPEESVDVIPNGIDPGDLQPRGDLRELRLRFARSDERLVLLVGRLVYEKGFQLALDALPNVLRNVPGVRFLVAGSGTHEAELRRQAQRLGLTDRGTFLGWIGDDLLHSLYRIADLTVVPSLYEPFGLVALEAMASDCPCIVADTGGLREVVPEGDRVGLRFRGGDAEHLAVMIERLLCDEPLRDRVVAQATEHVLRFEWGDVARRTLAVYESTLAAGSAAHQPARGALN
ncbi:MAG: glycosyltransferase family 4 protein [Solirubrobacteraceae bacterium]